MQDIAKTARRLFLGALAACTLAAQAQAPAFPTRPIQLVVAAPAGGSSDALARMLADDMGKILGQPIVIDNRPGGSGVIAAELVARAQPDGHTLMLSWIGNATSGALVPRQNFDINKDFVHITKIVEGSNVLVAHPSTGFHSLKDLLTFAKAHPGQVTYASSGNGSSGHLAMEMLKQRSGASMLHVPYRGGAAALTDLLAGQVQVMFLNQDAVIPYIKQGKLVPLAITSAQRNPQFPGLPTVAETYPGYEATAWAGLSAPKGTPANVVQALHDAALKAMAGSFKQKQEALGAVVVRTTPADYQAFVRSEQDKWTKVIKTAGIRPD
ncbi:tripartite tricarboxylate transporter substrate binding protein [Ramlibacter sp. G-1-2-2]|uniref:Tripartite tricarboxylate transporter substrate binding protein n=1 Tax=Ramlibacter agri TaxID=2728837 RepID=A0A848H353_9BURK|nr:tripartite tricarboxylate transporter substrate binding protein [Ramlibacter agri]NML44142.1 tripartite tricarboxylate transporter substrate binding protein [Ramlibacter agri]